MDGPIAPARAPVEDWGAIESAQRPLTPPARRAAWPRPPAGGRSDAVVKTPTPGLTHDRRRVHVEGDRRPYHIPRAARPSGAAPRWAARGACNLIAGPDFIPKSAPPLGDGFQANFYNQANCGRRGWQLFPEAEFFDGSRIGPRNPDVKADITGGLASRNCSPDGPFSTPGSANQK